MIVIFDRIKYNTRTGSPTGEKEAVSINPSYVIDIESTAVVGGDPATNPPEWAAIYIDKRSHSERIVVDVSLTVATMKLNAGMTKN